MSRAETGVTVRAFETNELQTLYGLWHDPEIAWHDGTPATPATFEEWRSHGEAWIEGRIVDDRVFAIVHGGSGSGCIQLYPTLAATRSIRFGVAIKKGFRGGGGEAVAAGEGVEPPLPPSGFPPSRE